jgi:hypothetical protein
MRTFCVSYMQIHVLMSDNSDNETLDNDSDVPTSSSRKQLRSFTSDSETSIIEGESSEPENCDDFNK